MGQLEPGSGKRVFKLFRVLLEALGDLPVAPIITLDLSKVNRILGLEIPVLRIR